jgi:ChaC-like protein
MRKPEPRRGVLAHAPSDVWLFGYGSLLWKPVCELSESRIATVRGWQNLRQGGTWAGRSTCSPAVGQALRRRLAFFVAPLVAVFLPTVLR